MVMELLRGQELGDELHARRKLPVREAVGYVLQACAAMAEAHRMGIVHRDLKPSNLFLCQNDGYRTVKVLDFGISKLAGDVQATMTTAASAFGTPQYMSPEQVRSVKNVDARTDIWSLGVVLYELLTGEPPFNPESATAVLVSISVDKPIPLRKRCPNIPRGLDDAVMKALEKDADAGFGDILEFAAAIAPHGPPRDDPAQAAIAAELVNMDAGDPSPGRKRRVIVVSAAIAVVLSGAAIVFWASSRAPERIVAVPEPVAAVSGPPTAVTASAPTSTAPTVEVTQAPEPSAERTHPTTAPTSSSQPAPQRLKPSAEPSADHGPKPAPQPSSTDDPKYL